MAHPLIGTSYDRARTELQYNTFVALQSELVATAIAIDPAHASYARVRDILCHDRVAALRDEVCEFGGELTSLAAHLALGGKANDVRARKLRQALVAELRDVLGIHLAAYHLAGGNAHQFLRRLDAVTDDQATAARNLLIDAITGDDASATRILTTLSEGFADPRRPTGLVQGFLYHALLENSMVAGEVIVAQLNKIEARGYRTRRQAEALFKRIPDARRKVKLAHFGPNHYLISTQPGMEGWVLKASRFAATLREDTFESAFAARVCADKPAALVGHSEWPVAARIAALHAATDVNNH